MLILKKINKYYKVANIKLIMNVDIYLEWKRKKQHNRLFKSWQIL